mgnify:FL=1
MQDNGCIRRLLFALCINDWSGGLNLIVALPPEESCQWRWMFENILNIREILVG